MVRFAQWAWKRNSRRGMQGESFFFLSHLWLFRCVHGCNYVERANERCKKLIKFAITRVIYCIVEFKFPSFSRWFIEFLWHYKNKPIIPMFSRGTEIAQSCIALLVWSWSMRRSLEVFVVSDGKLKNDCKCLKLEIRSALPVRVIRYWTTI